MPLKIAGKKISNWWLIGGAVGAVAVYLVVKHAGSGASSSSAAGSASSSSVDPVTGLPYSEDNSTDPATGLTYLQEAQEYGSVQAAEEAVTSGSAYYGESGTGDLVDTGVPTESYTGSTTPTPGTYSTNAAWAQAVTAGLTDLGYAPTDISAALGLYFQSQPLGSGSDGVSYLAIVQAAIAEFGPPPVGTFPLTAAPSSGGGVGSGTGGATPPVEISKPTKAPSGLTIDNTSATTISASWKPVEGATAYTLGITPAPKGGAAGGPPNRGPPPDKHARGVHNIGARTQYNVAGIVKGTTYTVTVAAVNSGGTGPSATHSFKAT
jgi:hypothetical protein